MADPARKLPEFAEATDPKLIDPRYPDPTRPSDPIDEAMNDRRVVEGRGAGKGAIIAAIVVVLAILAYMLFAPGTVETPAPGEPATTTTEPAPATPPATEPNTMAPAAPAEPAPATPPTNEAPAAPEQPAAPAPSSEPPAPAN